MRREGLGWQETRRSWMSGSYLGSACGQTSLLLRYPGTCLGIPVDLGDRKIGWGGGAESGRAMRFRSTFQGRSGQAAASNRLCLLRPAACSFAVYHVLSGQ